MGFTLKINLSYLSFNNDNKEGQKMFDGFFPRRNEKPEFNKDPRSPEYAQRVEDFMENYVFNSSQ